EAQVPQKSPPGASASDGQLTGSRPLGFTLPNSTSATAAPASVLPWYAIRSALALPAGPRPSGRPAMTTTMTGFPVAWSAAMSASWSGGGAAAGLSPSPPAYAFSPTAPTPASAEAAAATAPAWSGANVTLGSAAFSPLRTVVPGGIWSAGPMQQTCPAPKTPCQLTLQPPSWLVIESALGPVTTSLAPGDSGRRLPSLRSNVVDACAAFNVASRPAVTAASACAGSTNGWSNRPSANLSRRIRRTDSLTRSIDTSPRWTSWTRPAFQPA